MQKQNISSVFNGCGSYLPKKIITNLDLSKTVDTTDEWIISRTGIKQRHIINNNETTSFMAIEAAKRAFKNSSIKAEDIDLVIVGTTTPDKTFPATAAIVQSALGIRNGTAFDVQAVCAGFIYALTIADSLIKNKMIKNALVIGADAMSKIVDWTDRNSCVLFGDGAGAVILSSRQTDESTGILTSRIYTDGFYEKILYADGGVSTTQTSGFVRMQGKEVFRNAVEKMSEVIKEVLEISKCSLNDVKYIIPHQANIRIIEAIAHNLKAPIEKMIITLDMHANTSAASIPLALSSIYNTKINKGDLVLMAAIGGGISWGACLVRW